MFLSYLRRSKGAQSDFVEEEERTPRVCLIRRVTPLIEGLFFKPLGGEKMLGVYDLSESGLRFCPAGYLADLSRIRPEQKQSGATSGKLQGELIFEGRSLGGIQGHLNFLDAEVSGLCLDRVSSSGRLALSQGIREEIIIRSWQPFSDHNWHAAFDTNLWVLWAEQKTLVAFEFEMDSLLYRWGLHEKEAAFRTPNFGKTYLISAAELARSPRVSLPVSFIDRTQKLISKVDLPSEVYHQFKTILKNRELRAPITL
jgi:hypothetical protein